MKLTIEKLELIGKINKALIATISGSLIATDHPYITVIVLCSGAIINEVVDYLKKRLIDQQI